MSVVRERSHPHDYLCAEAKSTLDAIRAAKLSRDVPTQMFDQPQPTGLPDDTIICAQVTVKGALADIGGVPRAALLFTGLNAVGAPLPTWPIAGADADIIRLGDITQTMATGAVRARRRERNR